MAEISLVHRVDAPPDRVRDLVTDVEPFMAASGFDEVDVDGDRIHLAQRIGLATIELDLEIVGDTDAVLRYDQDEGIFEEMTTRYELEAVDGGTELTASTVFTLGGVAGTVLDSTIIQRQRTKELEAQFDYLDEQVA